MAFWTRAPLCLLVAWALACQWLVVTAYQGDISPEDAGLTNLELRHDYVTERVLTVVAELLETSVRQATGEMHRDLLTELGGMKSSLEELAQLSSRLEAMEQTVADLRATSEAASASQENLQKTMTSISSRQEELQRSLADIASRQDNLNGAIVAVSVQQQLVELALQAIESGQNNLTEVVVTLSGQLKTASDQPQSVEYLLDIVPTREELQQSLATQCRQDVGLSTTLASLTTTQQAMQETVSEQGTRLEGLADSLAILSERQRDVQIALTGLPSRQYFQQSVDQLSDRLDWRRPLEPLVKGQEEALKAMSSTASKLDNVANVLAILHSLQLAAPDPTNTLTEVETSLSVISEGQDAVLQSLSEQSARLAAVVQVVSHTPQPSDRPSLVTGRLLGAPCRSDSDCSTLREDTACGDDGLCRCAAGLQPVAGEVCSPYPRLGEQCRTSSDCLGATARSVCSNTRCSCPRGLASFNDTECRSGLGIGEPCSRDADCPTLIGLTCSDGACAVRMCDAPSSGALYQYRLVGGDSCSDGLVQFTFNSGQLWQYLCDSDWTREDAGVACRSLGLSGGVPLPWNNTAASEANFFSVKDYVCDGTEDSLSRCRRVYGRRNCAATELAMVRCEAQ